MKKLCSGLLVLTSFSVSATVNCSQTDFTYTCPPGSALVCAVDKDHCGKAIIRRDDGHDSEQDRIEAQAFLNFELEARDLSRESLEIVAEEQLKNQGK
jgi:hypothetical protein